MEDEINMDVEERKQSTQQIQRNIKAIQREQKMLWKEKEIVAQEHQSIQEVIKSQNMHYHNIMTPKCEQNINRYQQYNQERKDGRKKQWL